MPLSQVWWFAGKNKMTHSNPQIAAIDAGLDTAQDQLVAFAKSQDISSINRMMAVLITLAAGC